MGREMFFPFAVERLANTIWLFFITKAEKAIIKVVLTINMTFAKQVMKTLGVQVEICLVAIPF